MSDWQDLPLAFVDLETTGANPENDRITEVGIVTLSASGVSEWSQLVQPDATISPFIEQLTGISNAIVADAPRFAEIAEEVQQRLAGHLFLAHNARFDFSFLRQEFRRLGMEFRAPVVCTVKLSRKLYPQHHKHSLDSLIARHQLPMESRHRALADARAISRFWQIARQEIAAEPFAAAVQALLSPPSIPPQLSPQDIDALPEGHGVYVLYGEHETPLFVGKSHQLKKRVLAHFASDQKAGKADGLWHLTRRIEGLPCAGDLEVLLREAALLQTLRPSHNRQTRASDDTCFWHLPAVESGHSRLALLSAAEDIDQIDGQLYGPFASRREARTRLNELVKLNGLCPALLGLEKTVPGQPCPARKLRHCRGACCGEESALAHRTRVIGVLGKLKLAPWPFAGPAILREGETVHVIDRWRYLGSARDPADIQACLENAPPAFDRETYRILLKASHLLKPLAASFSA